MAFWSEIANAEPLRQFRWFVRFGGSANLDQYVYALKKCDKPKSKINTVQHKYLNHFFNYPGRLEWEDINMTFAAIADPNVSKGLYSLLRNAGYQYPGGEGERRTISKNSIVQQIGSDGLELIQVGADGSTALETWKIKNPFFTSVQFGALDYSSEEIVEVTCVVKYDSAEVI